MSSVKVSVVMAVYNSERYLPQALDSVLAQSLQDIEIICVDDGSDDASLSILNNYAAKDDRLRVYENKTVSDGAGAARNMGIQQATGEYLAILDSDDFFKPNLLETVYLKAKESSADIVLYDAFLYDAQLQVDDTVNWILSPTDIPAADSFSPEENAAHLFQMTIGAAWNALFSRAFVLANDLRFESIHHADDLGFVYLAFSLAKRISVVKKRLLHYRRNQDGSQSACLDRWPETGYEAMRRLKQNLVERGVYEKYRVSFVNKALDYALFYLDSMTCTESFDRLYFALQQKELRALDVFSVSPEEFYSAADVIRRDMIRELTPEAYLLQWYQGKKRAAGWEILREIPPGSRLALYGAGQRGKELYASLLREQNFQVCGWMDRNYQAIGFPVQSPDVLFEINFDYVVVTIKDGHIFRTIKEWLIRKGIPESKILWQE